MSIGQFLVAVVIAGLPATSWGAAELEVVKSLPTGVGYAIHADDQYVYMTNNDGLVITSVEELEIVGRHDCGGGFGVTTSGPMAFVGSGEQIVVLDVGDPGAIRELSAYDLGSTVRRMCSSSGLLFTTSNAGMDIFRFDPSGALEHLSHHEHPQARAVAVVDHTAYLASYNLGIEVLGVEDPTTPELLARLDEMIGAWDLQTAEGSLYVGRHGAGLSILDLSDPREPTLVGGFYDDDEGEAQGVFPSGGTLFVADNYGVEVLGLDDPANPEQIAEFADVSAAHDIVVAGGLVFVSTGSRELLVLRYE